MKAVILAGGLGTRLKPLTEAIPKPLLPIGEQSLLEIQIARLRQHGFDEIYLATNYKSEYISSFFGDGSRYGVKLVISRESRPLSTAGPLALLKDELQEPFISMNGDILSTIDFERFYQFALNTGADLTVAIKEIITPYDFGQIFYEGDFVTAVQEKPDIVMEVLAGMYVMTPRIFEIIPEDTYYGMDKLIQDMLASKRPVAKYSMDEYWLDIGQLPDYHRAQADYVTYFSSNNGNDHETGVQAGRPAPQ